MSIAVDADADLRAGQRERWLIAAALLSLYLVWGSTYLAIKWALVGFSPFAMAAMRFAAAGLLFFAWLRAKGVAAPSRAQWKNLVVMATLLLGVGNGLVCYAEQSVGSGLAAVAIASMPLWAAMFGAMYGRWPTRREALGLAIGFVGVILLNLGGDLAANPSGAIALLISPLAWAFGSVWSRGRDLPSPMMSTAAQMLVAAPVLALATLLHGEGWIRPGIDALAIGSLAYLAIFGSIVGFGAYVYLLDKVRPALATSYAYVNPPIAVLFGVLLGGEALHRLDLVAMAIILAGVVLITWKR
ncbi:MAG: drug/metabolite exporter YedA [Xanthomonadales bacterium]|nr:drug/metabolite exporter YedA [Xanthomonadales bacterium]